MSDLIELTKYEVLKISRGQQRRGYIGLQQKKTFYADRKIIGSVSKGLAPHKYLTYHFLLAIYFIFHSGT